MRGGACGGGAVAARTHHTELQILRRPDAQAIAFLADSKLSGFINGVSLPVDGGWIADASWESLRTRTRVGDASD